MMALCTFYLVCILVSHTVAVCGTVRDVAASSVANSTVAVSSSSGLVYVSALYSVILRLFALYSVILQLLFGHTQLHLSINQKDFSEYGKCRICVHWSNIGRSPFLFWCFVNNNWFETSKNTSITVQHRSHRVTYFTVHNF